MDSKKYAVTPFGVLEDDAGAYKSFDDESFWAEVLAPSEKDRLKKNKEGFLKDPGSVSTAQQVSSGLRFHLWREPVIASAGRAGMAFQMLASGTWSLNKDAIPDFLRLLEKLRDKYIDVLGDSKLMGFLEEAEHRAHELQVLDEGVGEAESVGSAAVKSHGMPGLCMGEYPLSRGIETDADGDPIVSSEIYFEQADGGFARVKPDKPKKRAFLERFFSGASPSSGGYMGESVRRIVSAPEGVDQRAYDEYVQQLVQTGVPEDQARQMADNLVAQIRQGTADFTANMGAGGNGLSQSRRAVMSEGDVIVNQDPDGEGADAGSGGDSGLGDTGGEGSFDFGESKDTQDVDDSFMDDVNDIQEFGANEPDLSQGEVVDALQAISQIVDTVLKVEGVEEDANLTSDEEGFVLDQVDDLAASFGDEAGGAAGEGDAFAGEPGVEAAEDEELGSLESVGAGLVRVLVAGQPVKGRAFSRVYLTKEKYGDLDAVICSGVNSGHSLVFDGEEDDSVLDTVVCSATSEINREDPVKTGYLKASVFKQWVKQSRGHRLAWRMAVNQAARRLGHKPATLPEVASVFVIASGVYDKWFKGGAEPARAVRSALLNRKVGSIRRVASALQKRNAEGKSLQVLRSDYNGYRNYQTWNVAVYLKQNAGYRSKAEAFLKSNRGVSYDQLIQGLGLGGGKTPDNVDWLDSRIDRDEMGRVLSFLGNSYKGNGMSARSNIGSAAQVDGGHALETVQENTPTGLSLAGKTLTSEEIDGENRARLTNVNGGDTSEVEDVNNTGYDGSLEADIDAGTEFNDSGYSFDSSKIAALELPIEGEDKTQVIELTEVGSGVYRLNRSFEAPGAGRCSFTRGNEARAVVSRNTRPAGIRANVDRVITLKNSKNALLLKSSSVLGVIGVEAPFTRGLKNARYSVFSRTGVNLVNEDGFYISSPKGPRMVIASAVSNKSVRQGAERYDIFSAVERAYLTYLKSCLAKAYQENAGLKSRLDQALKIQSRRAVSQSHVLNRERQAARQQVASSLADLQSIRVKTANAEAQRVFSASQQAVRDEQDALKAQAQKNIDYLASLM